MLLLIRNVVSYSEKILLNAFSICNPFQIIEICLIYIMYDPNYNYDDDMNDFADGDGGVMEIEEDGEEDAEDEYSDDDDMSWKVRRAAAKCLEAVVSSRRELLSDFYKVVSPALIARFKGEYHVHLSEISER